MKVVIVNNLYAPYFKGGAELSVEMLAKGLVANGVQVSVITLHDEEYIKNEVREGVDVWRLPLRNIYWPFGNKLKPRLYRFIWHLKDIYNRKAAKDFSDLLCHLKPDIVHTNNVAGFSVSIWKAVSHYGVPLVHTARDYYLLHPNSTLFVGGKMISENNMVAVAWSWIKKRASKNVSCFVGISHYVKDIHKNNGYFLGVDQGVVYNSVSIPCCSVLEAEDGKEGLVFGFIGRLDPSKGLDILLKAVSEIAGSEVNLLIAGTGDTEYVDQLHSKVSPNVDFLGYQNPGEFFQKIDWLIVPSLWAEPLGRVALEAYAHGIPVIASNAGGLNDIMWDGETGVQFDIHGGEADSSLRLAIERACKLNLEDIKKNCLKKAELFSTKRISKEYIGIYQSLIATKRK